MRARVQLAPAPPISRASPRNCELCLCPRKLFHTATVAACFSDAIASEIIEAGVVADGGMSEVGGVNVVTCLVRRETRAYLIISSVSEPTPAASMGGKF